MGNVQDLVNQVYNGDFRLAREPQLDFPDGWLRTGGDSNTRWEWIGDPLGPRAITIRHPSGPAAGILQVREVAIAAGENQRWEVIANIAAAPAGITCYLRVHMFKTSAHSPEQLEFALYPGALPETISQVFATVPGTIAVCLEIGIVETGDVVIHGVEAYRVYPRLPLRFDERGQLYIRHVHLQTLGEILKPVRIAAPVPVSVSATITADIRSLSPNRDGVRIYGTSAAPVATTDEGVVQVQIAGQAFYDAVENVTATTSVAATAVRDVAKMRVFSFAVLNSGPASALVRVEISPDGSHWVADTAEREVEVGQLTVLVSRFFLRYARVAYWADASTSLTVWFQGQG